MSLTETCISVEENKVEVGARNLIKRSLLVVFTLMT